MEFSPLTSSWSTCKTKSNIGQGSFHSKSTPHFTRLRNRVLDEAHEVSILAIRLKEPFRAWMLEETTESQYRLSRHAVRSSIAALSILEST
jgi:hypothetical protein